jgi:prevent-host-death family protein
LDGERYDTTAAEVTRNFGHWQDRAMQGPVRVTHHGRPRVVIVSAQDFERLNQSSPRALDTAEIDEAEALSAVLDESSEGFIVLDEQLRILRVNRTVEAFLGLPASRLIGRDVEEIEQGGRRGVFAERYRWVVRSGEAVNFEADFYLRPDRSLDVRAFPFRGGVGVLLSNRTEVKQLRREREEWRAFRAALEAHEMIASATLNVLGFFTAVNAAFAKLVGFSQERLQEARLVDLLASADRPRVADGLNGLLQQKALTFVTEVAVLTREAARRPLSVSIAPKMRDFVCDGFTLVALETAPAGEP